LYRKTKQLPFHLKSFIKIGIGLIALLTALVISLSVWINYSVRNQLFSETSALPHTHAALVLGTSHKVAGGNENLYFKYRIEAAAQLYHSGTVTKIILSGDNGTMQYNEPREMRKALMKLDVPDSCIVLDFAGFRTFDSVVRSNKVFGQDSIIIVSQLFHLQRALFIANNKNLAAFGYIAVDPGQSFKTHLREYPARVSAFIDCFILHTKPRYLGEQIQI